MGGHMRILIFLLISLSSFAHDDCFPTYYFEDLIKEENYKVLLKNNHNKNTSTSKDGPRCTVLYWPNKNLGFGHTALFVHSNDNIKKDIYISYAMGNNYLLDINKHEMEPEKFTLPPLKRKNYDNFVKWYEESPYNYRKFNIYYFDTSERYGDQYSFLNNNCAHAVVNSLKAFGYKLKLTPHWGLRPYEVKKEAKRLLKQ